MKWLRSLLIVTLLVSLWIGSDLLTSRKSDIREFDPVAIARLETEMWKAYYERRKLKLFRLLAQTLREQFHAPYWKSWRIAAKATQAALTFQRGSSRKEYELALPYLESYYQQIKHLAGEDFSVSSVAQRELEWWIIRREREEHPPEDWVREISLKAAEIYKVPQEHTLKHAQLRVEAMLIRDQRGGEIRLKDWENIETVLIKSWTALYERVNQK